MLASLGFQVREPILPALRQTTLGKNCKLLLDSDECPNCQKGKVTVEKPRCDECGFVVDRLTAAWG